MAVTQQHGDGKGAESSLPQRLRALRQQAGLTNAQAAAAIGVSTAKISRWENGLFTPTPEEAAAIAGAYGAPAAVRRRLVELARDVRESTPGRVVLQRGVWRFQQKLGRIEASAQLIRSFQASAVLGVLQTSAYARVVFSAGDDLSKADVEAAVQARLDRQPLLAETGREWRLIMGEGALRWTIGSAELMAEQLDRIIDTSRLPTVRVGIVPFGRPLRVLVTHGWHIYDRRAVHVGTKTATALMSDPHDVGAYQALFDELEQVAAWGDDARELIARVRGEYLSRSGQPEVTE